MISNLLVVDNYKYSHQQNNATSQPLSESEGFEFVARRLTSLFGSQRRLGRIFSRILSICGLGCNSQTNNS